MSGDDASTQSQESISGVAQTVDSRVDADTPCCYESIPGVHPSVDA